MEYVKIDRLSIELERNIITTILLGLFLAG
jgi:hypothetical protein